MGRPPADVLHDLRACFGEVEVCEAVGGGCITPAYRVRIPSGEAFLKYGDSVPPGLFSVEAEGLRSLRAAAASLHVPEVYAVRDAEAGAGSGYLLLEWLEAAAPGPRFGEKLGRGLSELHRFSGSWGWPAAGFIGPLPVDNSGCDTWAEFWRDRRLRPQLELTAEGGWRVGRPAEWESLWSRLADVLAPAEDDGASLIHGDLWNGNVLEARVMGEAVPAIVDPSACFGHREVDLAMAELFGGFPADFLAAYEEVWPLQPGYRSTRRPVYQLFYLLVHVNLFGGAYVRRAERALREALAASS